MRKLWVLALCIAVASGGGLAADSETEKENKWFDRIKFGGDLRLRFEYFDWDQHYDDGKRQRFRYRLRVGMKAQMTQKLMVGVQLVSGNPDNPISDNQTFDDGFDKNTIAISEAYAKVQATDFFGLYAGKFRPKKLWSAADFEWDDDLAVNGFLQTFDWKFGGPVKKLDFNLWQLIMNESSSGSESRNFGGQLVPTFGLGKNNDLAVGVTYQSFENPSPVADLYFEDDLVIDADYVTNFVDPATGELISDFQVGSLFAEWKNKSFSQWPIKVSLFYYKNFGASDEAGEIWPAPDPGASRTPLASGTGSDNDTAFFGRIQVGDYKKPGQVAVRLSRYDSEPDAIFFAYAQSDTRRSSNVDGWRTDVRVGMPAKGYVNVTWYRTDWTLGDDTTMDRFQLDYIFRF
jgi:hypothetical protein